jgi:hypothetical protein
MPSTAMTTWKTELEEELSKCKEAFTDIISITLTNTELNTPFDGDYGRLRGKPFTAWTKTRVYFPVNYDGSEFVGSASRNPDGLPTAHIGRS